MTESLLPMSGGSLMHVRSNNARASLDSLNLQVPDKPFHYSSIGELGFIATLGQSEFLLYADKANDTLVRLETDLGSQAYVFPRDDLIVRLGRVDWKQVLLYVCSFDFSKCNAGEFILANMAGVSTWFRIPDENAPLVFGCDPSFGHYLQHTMRDVIRECDVGIQLTTQV